MSDKEEKVKMEVQAPKGTKDMLPQDAYKWHFVEKSFREIGRASCRERV